MNSACTPPEHDGNGAQEDNLSLWTRASKRMAPEAQSKASSVVENISAAVQHLSYLASAEFGPIGVGWGYDIEEHALREGAPILAAGNLVSRELLHSATIRFWYRREGHEHPVNLTARSHSFLVMATPYGCTTDPDAPARTELKAFASCMQKIGFNVSAATSFALRTAFPQTRPAETNGVRDPGNTGDHCQATDARDIPADERAILDTKVKGIQIVDQPDNIRRAAEMISSILKHPKAIAEFREKADQRIEEIERGTKRSAHF